MSKSKFENPSAVEELCVNTIRTLSMDAVQKANSGHPGAPMGLAPAGYTLWAKILKHNPNNPDWYDRDRFVLSGGHASMLLYSLLFLTGYDLSLEDIRNFRQWESKTPGHPEYRHVPGVETTTGPLGQGFCNAVGMALAERHLAAVYNKPGHEIVDHNTYLMCGDGDLMEGITAEAASFAGHMGLSRLICLYDDNGITIEGKTDIAFTEDVGLRFQAYHWNVIHVDNGNNVNSIFEAIQQAKEENKRPTLILLRTNIAYGSPNKQDTSDAHGSPLGEEEVKLTKKNLGWPEDEQFMVPDEALALFRKCVTRGEESEKAWQERFNAYQESYPDLAENLSNAINGILPVGWEADLPKFSANDGPIATRAASGKVLNAAAGRITSLIGGSADLEPSTKTSIGSADECQRGNYGGRNIRFGVREHAMGSILSGMALHKGLIPYGGTFLVFADYMKPSIRLAAMMGLPVIYVFTHDSIAVGEDGPTHQPIEHLASLRIIPGLVVLRPADATETTEAWRQAIKIKDKPVALILSRQKLPVLDREIYGPAGDLENGAYVLADSDDTPQVILMATGSEVHIALSARDILQEKGVSARVVSMPSLELFEKSSHEYKESVLLPEVSARIAVEAGHPMGWERYTGEKGAVIGIDHFGASAPGGTLMKEFGFTAEAIVAKALEILK